MGRQRREEKTDKTQREEKRLVKEVEAGIGQHLESCKHGAW